MSVCSYVFRSRSEEDVGEVAQLHEANVRVGIVDFGEQLSNTRLRRIPVPSHGDEREFSGDDEGETEKVEVVGSGHLPQMPPPNSLAKVC